ncbi:hypothetical protein FRB96_003030, partial [Tulasnella sp. 330]
TVSGASTTTFDATGTLTEIATVEVIAGFTTYTAQPTPPPRMARRAKKTIIETEVCSEASTLIVYPTATYSDPSVTSTIMSYGNTATATVTTTYRLG